MQEELADLAEMRRNALWKTGERDGRPDRECAECIMEDRRKRRQVGQRMRGMHYGRPEKETAGRTGNARNALWKTGERDGRSGVRRTDKK